MTKSSLEQLLDAVDGPLLATMNAGRDQQRGGDEEGDVEEEGAHCCCVLPLCYWRRAMRARGVVAVAGRCVLLVWYLQLRAAKLEASVFGSGLVGARRSSGCLATQNRVPRPVAHMRWSFRLSDRAYLNNF